MATVLAAPQGYDGGSPYSPRMGELLMSRRWHMTAMGLLGAVLVVWAILSFADGAPTVEAPHPARADRADAHSLVDDIHPTLEVHTGYNQTLRRYTIEFLVGNLADAGNAIERFGIADISRPTAVRNPAQWQGLYGVFGRPTALIWTCWDTLSQPPMGYTGMNTYRGPYVIDPGDTAHRFQVFLDYLPPTFHYYAWGYDTIPGGVGTWQDPFAVGWTGTVTLDVTGVRAGPPKSVEFMGPKPNPATHGTSISFGLPRDATVVLAVYDVRGARVRELVSGERPPGINLVTWDGSNDQGKACGAGSYYAKLTIDGKPFGVKRITLLK